MNAEQFTTILSNLITGSGVIFFLWMWIRALKIQISEMNKTIEVQQQTLKAMETRVSETEKIGKIYRQLFEELPTEVEKWKVAILKLRDERIVELEKANQDKDERLQKTAQIEIDKLELQRQALEDVPKLVEQFKDTAITIEQRLSTAGQLVPPDSSDGKRADNKEKWKTIAEEIGKPTIVAGIVSSALLLQKLLRDGKAVEDDDADKRTAPNQ